METEEAAKVAKETVYGSIKDNIHVVHSSKSDPSQRVTLDETPKGTCPRCGKTDHMTKPLTARVATRSSCITGYEQSQHTSAVHSYKVPHLNLLGRDAIVRLGINVSALMGLTTSSVHPISNVTKPDINLQNACKQLCQEFPDLFKPELGCLKDVQLEPSRMNSARPTRQGLLEGQTKSTLRVCGDYSVTVNPQLEEHRYPMPRPEDLMQRLGGGHGFTKIDLADAYNQIQLSPESQKRLALSTHRGVLLQMRLPFGISSAPGYFQELMDKLTCDLQGVAVYMDDILVSGATDSEHLQNLRSLLKRLVEKGLRCRLEKCSFAQSSIEYFGHTLSRQGVSKGKKVDAVKLMPPPENVLMQYRRTPLADGYSPSELLNGRQIRAKIDTLLPSPAHMAQARQAREATKAQAQENPERVTPIYNIGTPCYALYCGPRQEKDPKWVPAVVTKVFGSRSVNVRVIPRGGTWRRHIEQLRLRYGVEEDADPGEVPTQEGQEMLMTNAPSIPEPPSVKPRAVRTNPRWPTGSEYGPGHPRRSTRQKPHH
eukprot:Em0559g3a